MTKDENKKTLEGLIDFISTNYGITDSPIFVASDYSSAVISLPARNATITIQVDQNFCLNYISDKLIQITTGMLGSLCNIKHFNRWYSEFIKVVSKCI